MMEIQNWEQYPCLHPLVIQTAKNSGYSKPTHIQSEVFKNYKHYFDFLVASQTGSGKTISFAAPIVSDLLSITAKTQLPNRVIALVMAPTRELAQQIESVFKLLLKETSIKQVSIFGGLSVLKQLRVLKEKGPQIIVGTPGRIQQLLEEQQIDFSFLKYLVIDEADRMIEMGHYKQLDQILQKIFNPKIQQTFEADFEKINKRLSEGKEHQFYYKENGKKKKMKINLNSIATDQIFQLPQSLFQIAGEKNTPMHQQNQIKKEKRRKMNKMEEEVTQLQTQLVMKLKRKIFFISATLTRDFKGMKYFIKKDKSKGKSKQKSKEKNKKHIDKQQEDYIPKLKALLSRIKFDAKPKIIDLSSQIILPEKLKELYCFCEDDLQKFATILCYIREMQIGSKCIIFTNTIRAVKRVKFFIDSAGIKSAVLHSHMMQKQRLDKLQKFQKSGINVLISTDVAARGLDFTINNVIQFSVPINGDTYVHRVGRTARANRSGEALVLISQKQSTKWQQICNIITQTDSQRKSEKYKPPHIMMKQTLERVKQFQWIRLNQQEMDNKRIDRINQMQAEELGVDVEEEKIVKKVNKVSKEEQIIHQQMIKKKIKQIRSATNQQNKNNAPTNQKVWRKNKFILSLDQIKKFL